VLFIGVRGSGEHDKMGPAMDAVFQALKAKVPPNVPVEGKWVDYPADPVSSLLHDAFWAHLAPSVVEGTGVLNQMLVPYLPGPSQTDAATCVVLGGYSQGAWVIHDLFYGNPHYGTPKHDEWLSRMSAVVLLGDPTFQPGEVTEGGLPGPGLLRSWQTLGLVPGDLLPAENTYYVGHSDVVHSWCADGDPVCNYQPILDRADIEYCLPPAPLDALCAHTHGYGDIEKQAGSWAADRVHAPSVPSITNTAIHTDGVMVWASVAYTGDAVGFGFQGINRSGWARETHPFTSPSYGRWNDGQIEYPFNHLCGTSRAYQSDVEFWVYNALGQESAHVPIHLAC
jgi:hypothetical protein